MLDNSSAPRRININNMRPIRTISVFPTLLTLGNLVCGFFAIVVASRVDEADRAQSAGMLDRLRERDVSAAC